jgi:hypothetical protein
MATRPKPHLSIKQAEKKKMAKMKQGKRPRKISLVFYF